jgi:4-diphosphocytidyl-2-C-methyl-D-erythritol kinase
VSRRIVRREAPAKLNVSLRVVRAREDGYHDIESLVVPLSLADVVTVKKADRLHVDVRGVEPLTGEVPAGGLNLALIAALALADAREHVGGAEVVIDKRIPIAGGLGGGSADAAATIQALDELWGLGMTDAELAEIGARIGSDVPATLAGRPAVIRGRGETVEPFEMPRMWWVLVPFDFGVRSPDAYRWWDESGTTPGDDLEPVLRAAAEGDPERLGPLLFNDLQHAVCARHPPIADAIEALLQAGALGAVMSGSGSAVVGLARDQRHADELAAAVTGAIVVSGPPAG